MSFLNGEKYANQNNNSRLQPCKCEIRWQWMALQSTPSCFIMIRKILAVGVYMTFDLTAVQLANEEKSSSHFQVYSMKWLIGHWLE